MKRNYVRECSISEESKNLGYNTLPTTSDPVAVEQILDIRVGNSNQNYTRIKFHTDPVVKAVVEMGSLKAATVGEVRPWIEENGKEKWDLDSYKYHARSKDDGSVQILWSK